jgi:hypothetical protein
MTFIIIIIIIIIISTYLQSEQLFSIIFYNLLPKIVNTVIFNALIHNPNILM